MRHYATLLRATLTALFMVGAAVAPAQIAEQKSQTLTRDNVIATSPRVPIQTTRLQGTIALNGGRIDDLSLTQYRQTVDPNSPVIVLFSPSGAPDAYYAEFGWVPASGTTTAMPGPDTM